MTPSGSCEMRSSSLPAVVGEHLLVAQRRAPTRRGRSRAGRAGPSARCATGGSACRPPASACARASPARDDALAERARSRRDAFAAARAAQRGCAARALRVLARATALRVVRGDVGERRAPVAGLVIFIARRRRVSCAGCAWRRKSSRIGVSSRNERIAGRDGTPDATARRTRTTGRCQRIASTMWSGSDHASTTRLRPRSLTAWWWIELVLTQRRAGIELRERRCPARSTSRGVFCS